MYIRQCIFHKLFKFLTDIFIILRILHLHPRGMQPCNNLPEMVGGFTYVGGVLLGIHERYLVTCIVVSNFSDLNISTLTFLVNSLHKSLVVIVVE